MAHFSYLVKRDYLRERYPPLHPHLMGNSVYGVCMVRVCVYMHVVWVCACMCAVGVCMCAYVHAYL